MSEIRDFLINFFYENALSLVDTGEKHISFLTDINFDEDKVTIKHSVSFFENKETLIIINSLIGGIFENEVETCLKIVNLLNQILPETTFYVEKNTTEPDAVVMCRSSFRIKRNLTYKRFCKIFNSFLPAHINHSHIASICFLYQSDDLDGMSFFQDFYEHTYNSYYIKNFNLN